MSRLGVYDPKNVSLIVGAIIVEGYADGTFVTAERNNDSFTLQVGSTGESTRTKSNDKSGRVTFTLLQSSPTNDLLSALVAVDELSPNGAGVVPMALIDENGTTAIAAKTAWVVRPATVEFGGEGTNREWIVETDELETLVGSANTI